MVHGSPWHSESNGGVEYIYCMVQQKSSDWMKSMAAIVGQLDVSLCNFKLITSTSQPSRQPHFFKHLDRNCKEGSLACSDWVVIARVETENKLNMLSFIQYKGHADNLDKNIQDEASHTESNDSSDKEDNSTPNSFGMAMGNDSDDDAFMEDEADHGTYLFFGDDSDAFVEDFIKSSWMDAT